MYHKILLVVRREYTTRVRKKSFIIMTLLAPLLVVGFYGVMFYFMLNGHIGEKQKNIIVNDPSGFFDNKLEETEYYTFTYANVPLGSEKSLIERTGAYGILHIPTFDNLDSIGQITLVAGELASISTVNSIEMQLKKCIKDKKLKDAGLSNKMLDALNRTQLDVKTVKATQKGMKSGNAVVSTALGYVSAILIYLFIFLYGVQVMRGVIEEKTNRIVEVIISSLKPFELMMGKIIGIALVGLTQFIIWLVLIATLGSIISATLMSSMDVSGEALKQVNQTQATTGNTSMVEFITGISNFNYGILIFYFLFYFITGYLFYGALFAAIGSAVDNETDTQQFMLPITMPLVFALILAQTVVTTNPNGIVSFWLSIIPLTSPIVMMVRIPFGVSWWETTLSMLAMVGGFIFTVWLAARIYRIGILMYGKKVGYKEIMKWFFYKG